jgi:hypothetical protein
MEDPGGIPPPLGFPEMTVLASHRIADFRPPLAFPNRTILRGSPELLEALNRYRGWPNSWEYSKTTAWIDAFLKPEIDAWSATGAAFDYAWPEIHGVSLDRSLKRAVVGYRISSSWFTTEWRVEDGRWTFVRIISEASE